MAGPSPSPVFEPNEIDDIPDQLETLGKAQKKAVLARTIELARELAPLARLVTLKSNASPLDRAFERLARKERFLPLEGITRLSTGLRLPAARQWRRDRSLRDALYVLYRLQIAKTIVSELSDEGIDVPLAFVLTVFRREGGFAVPLGLEDLRLGVVPPPMPAPNWPLTNNFLGPHFSFHLEKESPPWVIYGPLIRGVRERIESRAQVLTALARLTPPSDALIWLGAAKQAAFTLYLLLVGGLDYMTAGVAWPGFGGYENQRLIFRYIYARNRVGIRPALFLADVLSDGDQVFRDIARVDAAGFRAGTLPPTALTLLLRGIGEEQQHYVVPARASVFTTAIVKESVVALESMRKIPLWCGGKAFDPPLPAAVAYIRYNGGDVNFTMMVLNLLDRVLNGSSLSSPRLTRNPAAKLRNGLAEFRRSRNPEVWTILDEWKEGTEDTTFLKSELIRKGFQWRKALLEDAEGGMTSLPGPSELRFRGDLNSRGRMETALPLLEALTEKKLWPAFLDVMVSPTGTGKRPWIGHSPERIGNEVGLNVLRFYYTIRGYETVFR